MITPEEFKQISYEILQKINKKEPAIRTSIGRKYYYIFLELRETIKVNVSRTLRQTLDEELSSRESLHCILRETLFAISKNINNTNTKILFRKAANSLKTIRKLRNESDYKLMSTIPLEILNNIEKHIKDIEIILPEIQKVGKNVLDQCLTEAIQKCNRR